jgi:hypothetical protein
MTTATASRFVIKGINDEESSCSCCGKTGLKRVVWIEDTETGEINFFGTSCATQPAKCFGITKKEVNSALRKFEADQVAVKNAAIVARHKAAYDLAVAEYTGGFRQVQSPLKPDIFFTLPNDSEQLDALIKKHRDAI